MIARLTNGALVLGLSAENVKRLKEGRPIRLTRASHPGAPLPDFPIYIMYCETEQDCADELRTAERGFQ